MEKEKSNLRKLKRKYKRKIKQEESSEPNKRFQVEPGKVYSCLKEIIAEDDEKDIPKYEVNPRDREGNQNKFKNMEEASTCSYWKSLWESEVTGNTDRVLLIRR